MKGNFFYCQGGRRSGGLATYGFSLLSIGLLGMAPEELYMLLPPTGKKVLSLSLFPFLS